MTDGSQAMTGMAQQAERSDAAGEYSSPTLCVEWMGDTFEFHPEGGVWHRSSRTLFVADLHFGKAATFRSAGIPLPAGATDRTLDLLGQLVDRVRPRRLIILGDLVHARPGLQQSVIDAVTRWRAARSSLAIDLVMGNHDRRAGPMPPEWNMETHEYLLIDERWRCVHDPAGANALHQDQGVLAGHLHPGIRIDCPDGGSRKFRCFHLQPRVMVLPAFGMFTGSALIRPAAPDRVIAAEIERKTGARMLVEVTSLVIPRRT